MRSAPFCLLFALTSTLGFAQSPRASLINQPRGLVSPATRLPRGPRPQGSTTEAFNAAAATTNSRALKFAPAVHYGSGGYSSSLVGGAVVAVADVNGDGKPDIVAANECIDSVDCNNGALGVLLGNGDGTFKTAVSYGSAGYYAESVSVADVNGDGKPDIVVAIQCNDSINCNNGLVDVLLGNGDGSFQTTVAYGSGAYFAEWLAVADVNGDGKPDIVVLNACIDSSDCDNELVGVLLGNGDGTFQTAVTYGSGGTGGNHGNSAAVADVNGDGKPDIVVTSLDELTVLQGNGDGSFQNAVAHGSGGRFPFSAAVADVNGDGKPDIVVGNECNSTVECPQGAMGVLLGNGDGTFQTAMAYGSGGRYAFSTVVAELDGDGKPDIMVANLDGSVNALLGNGDGTFQSAVNYGTSGYSFAVADVNGDGKPDLLAMDGIGGSVAVFINIGGAATAITLVSSLNPSSFDQSVTFTTTITSEDSQNLSTPTGTVSFFDGTTKLGDSSIDSIGDSSLTVSTLAPGPHSITATYSGDREFAQNTSSVVSQFVQGGQPSAGLAPAVLSFTSQPLGITSAAQNLTLTNTAYIALSISSIGITGANSSDFAQTNNCGTSLPIAGSCSISVTFTPAALGSAFATLNVADNAANSPQSVALIGTGTPAAILSPTVVRFESQPLGVTSAPQNLTLTNASNIALSISSIGITGTDSSDFAQSNNCGTSLPSNRTCNISVTFTPAALGSAVASLRVTDNLADSPQTVALVGNGTPAAVFTPTAVDFGGQRFGVSSAPQNLRITNASNIALSISSIEITGTNRSDFAQSNNCGASVPVTGVCDISITFTPAEVGNAVALLNLIDNLPGSPRSVSLSGTGLGASVGLSPVSMSFSNQYVGTSGLPQTLTVTNTGNDALTVSTVSSSVADFGTLSTCTNAVSPGMNCTIGVFFDPTAPGTRTGTLLIHDNGIDSPHSVSLSGIGQDFSLNSSGSSTATISSGQVANYTVAVNPAGGFTQTIALSCNGAPEGSICSLSSSSATLNGSTATSVLVTVSTSANASVSSLPSGYPLSGSKLALWLAPFGVAGLAVLGSSGGRSRIWHRRMLYGFLFLCVFFFGMIWTACGGGTSSVRRGGGTPAGTYNLTVTGTFKSGSANLTHSTKLTLVVN